MTLPHDNPNGGLRSYSPPEVDRIWGIGDLTMKYPKSSSSYLRETINQKALFQGSQVFEVGCGGARGIGV